jgi:hypothetical protein
MGVRCSHWPKLGIGTLGGLIAVSKGRLYKVIIGTNPAALPGNQDVRQHAGVGTPGSDGSFRRLPMRYDFREGDWVRHHSCPEPIRIIGIGPTIAVQFSNRDMQAFEPSELEKVSIPYVLAPMVHVHRIGQDRGVSSVGWLSVITSFTLIWLITLVLVVIAGAGW